MPENVEATQRSTRRPQRSFLRLLAPIMVVALAIRLWAIWYYRSLEQPLVGDPWIYYMEGQYIADGRGWINPVFYEAYGIRREMAMHPPAFPVYLSLWAMIGFDALGWFQIANLLVGLAVVAAVGLLARNMLNDRVALIAAAICALNPSLWSLEAMLLAEPLAILATVAMLGATLHFRDKLTVPAAVLAGIAFGIGVLTRAELGLAAVLVIVLLAVTHRSRNALKMIALSAIVAGLTVLPWSVHNSLRFSQPTPVSNGLGVTMAATYCEETSGDFLGYWAIVCARRGLETSFSEWLAQHPNATPIEIEAFPVCAWDPSVSNGPRTAVLTIMAMSQEQMCGLLDGYKATGDYPYYFYPEFDDSEIEQALRTSSVEWAVDHPSFTARSVAARIGRVLGVYRPDQQIGFDTIPEGRPPLWAKLSWWFYYLLLAPVLIGGWKLFKTSRSQFAILLIPFVVSLAAVSLTFGGTRYRAIGEPSMAVLAAVGLCAIWTAGRARWFIRTVGITTTEPQNGDDPAGRNRSPIPGEQAP